jgi:hypothetical protein
MEETITMEETTTMPTMLTTIRAEKNIVPFLMMMKMMQ